MTVQFDEYPQWTDASGTPLTSGKVYIGTVNLAPKTNLISIFSDRDLTVALANPQTLDAFGKATTRIFIPGKYSYLVEDSAEVQVELELDAGAELDTGTTSLDSVLGTNVITASGEATTVTSYVDKEVYTLKIANTNTSSVTLNIDSVGAKAIVKNFDQAISAGDFTQNQIIRVAYNSTSDNFAWVDASVKTKRVTKGSDIASASSITVPDNDGNYFDITGTTTIATINGVAGTYHEFQMDGAVTFTNSAGLDMIGSADFTSAAGDVLKFYQLTASTVINTNIAKADGSAIAKGQWVTLSDQTASSSASIDFESVITTKHDNYRIRYWNVRPATDATTLDLRTSTDNGSSYDSGASDYNYFWAGGRSSTGASVFENNTGNTRMVLQDSSTAADLGNASNESTQGIITFDNPLGTTFLKLFSFENVNINSSGEAAGGKGTGVRNSAADIDAVQLLMSSGNIAVGRFILEGLIK